MLVVARGGHLAALFTGSDQPAATGGTTDGDRPQSAATRRQPAATGGDRRRSTPTAGDRRRPPATAGDRPADRPIPQMATFGPISHGSGPKLNF